MTDGPMKTFTHNVEVWEKRLGTKMSKPISFLAVKAAEVYEVGTREAALYVVARNALLRRGCAVQQLHTAAVAVATVVYSPQKNGVISYMLKRLPLEDANIATEVAVLAFVSKFAANQPAKEGVTTTPPAPYFFPMLQSPATSL